MNPEIDTYLDSFYNYLQFEKHYSPHTIEAYQNDLTQWVNYIEEENLDWVNVEHKNVYAFLSRLHREKGISKSSQARKTASIKSFYGYCERNELIEKNVLKKLRPPKYRRPLPKPLRPVELENYLEEDTVQNQWIQTRDKAILEILYSSGMRISELLPLNADDITDIHGRVVESIPVKGKGGKERVVFFGGAARKSLAHYLEIRPECLKAGKSPAEFEKNGGPLFINFHGQRLTRGGASYILKKRKQYITADGNVSPHTLRHSFATDMINSGADIRVVQEMLGHASVSTTQNYTHVAKERIQSTFWNCHPHAKKEK